MIPEFDTDNFHFFLILEKKYLGRRWTQKKQDLMPPQEAKPSA
jgi:hypothetical protein